MLTGYFAGLALFIDVQAKSYCDNPIYKGGSCCISQSVKDQMKFFWRNFQTFQTEAMKKCEPISNVKVNIYLLSYIL